jgi:type II secretion system protein N
VIILNKLRYVLYSALFAIIFLCAAYCTFPKDVLKYAATSVITNTAFTLGPKNRGLPTVSLDDVSLWRLSGMRLNDLKILWPANKDHVMIALKADSISSRLGIISLLFGGQNILGQSRLYGGELHGQVKLKKDRALDVLALSATKIDLGKMDFVEATLGSPLQGIINVNLSLKGNTELIQDGKGSITLSLDNLVYGPGSISLPVGGFVSSLTVPKVTLGRFLLNMILEKGEMTSKSCSLQGGDMEGDMKLSITLGRNPAMSRINGDGWFRIKPEFVGNNETLKMLFDLIPELKEAQANNNNKVGLSLRGSLLRPQVRLEKYLENK